MAGSLWYSQPFVKCICFANRSATSLHQMFTAYDLPDADPKYLELPHELLLCGRRLVEIPKPPLSVPQSFYVVAV
ncbi:hypothetical protein FOPE_07762 [Fonsecaea pedrosoi]|nr:hypothetical protein FOPE_07762 [Fonsecaea pedrosoi]